MSTARKRAEGMLRPSRDKLPGRCLLSKRISGQHGTPTLRREKHMLGKRHILQVAAVVLLGVCVSCQTHRHKPLSSEAVIAAPAIYESQEDKLLVLKHQGSLNAIYKKIRDRFRPSKLEFFLISGICFRKLQLKNTYDTY